MRRAAAALASLAVACGAMAADEDKDLDLIPKPAPAAATETSQPATFARQKIFVEDALVFTSLRDALLVPSPPPLPPHWEDRLFADARLEWAARPGTSLVYSGRLSLRTQEDLGFPNRANLTHDLRELYASVEPEPRRYVDIGRVNLKSGVALGFNPTDFFKARAVVDPLTADPRALRENRLGTVMLRGAFVDERGSASLAYAPDLANPDPITPDLDRGFDPLLGRTNAEARWIAKGSVPLANGSNPEALLYHEPGRSMLGINIAESVGQSSVVYLEWAGGRRLGIVDEALAFGRRTGAIPPAAPDVVSQGGDERFRSQLAAGASYTTESRITFNLEYHYNGAGMTRSDWQRWFAAGEGQPASSPIARQLWYIRGYAADRQEPMQRHAIFVRADWVDFLIPKLELTGFALVDASDGSTLLQLEADYARTDAWSFGMLANGTTGGRRSNFGSLPRAASVLARATRYF